MTAAMSLPGRSGEMLDRLKANPKLPMMVGGAALAAAIAVGVLWSRRRTTGCCTATCPSATAARCCSRCSR